MCFIHRTVNHSENFINPQVGIHIEDIEPLWSKFKKANEEHIGEIRRLVGSIAV